MADFPKNYDFRAAETTLRARWADDDAFKWDPAQPAESDYVIDTPPPTVSGTLHIGHVYSYTQADIIARYFRMSGRNVLYPIGWDDNGLPTERLVEKVKKVRGGNMSREEFVALCRSVIPEYEDQFRDLFSRLALSVDWGREYQTISDESRKISQMSFLDLYDRGLLERRMEPTLWDPADRTAIAQAEVEEDEREGVLNYIPFGVEGGGEAVIATTRPELLAGCGALMIHPDHPRARDLIGKRAITPLYNVLVPILADEDADPEKGSGIVMCCTFGDVKDIQWWRHHGLPLRVVIDQAGKMKPELPIGGEDWPSADADGAREVVERLAGLKAEKARAAILEILSERGLLQKQETLPQIVPVAERSRAPLEIIVTPQWFIRTLDFKDELIAKGREIEWKPDYMRQRFESWVEGLKWDWAISRQRHFGVSIPVWYSKRAGEEDAVIIPGVDALPVDPSIDLPEGYSEDEVEREYDVMDTWATSSVSPQLVTRTISDRYGLDHDAHERLFPMAMRPQAHEIIRTWAFYTIVKALHHQDVVPWRSICISGWCLAGDGSKMSKSKGNVIDPIKLLDQHGSDVVRYWTGTSRLGNDTRLDENTLKQGRRLVTKLWNAARLAHLALEGQDVAAAATAREDLDAGRIAHPLDQWLLGQLAATVEGATKAFETYEYAAALRQIETFFWGTYCDNYLEIVKQRSRVEGAPGPDQLSALLTLHHATDAIVRLFAPFTPYVCESLHDARRGHGREDSAASTVHRRGGWPTPETIAPVGLNGEIGRLALAVIAGVRKLKTNLTMSLKTPAKTLWVRALDDASPDARSDAALEALMAPAIGDVLFVANAHSVVFGLAPEGVETLEAPEDGVALGIEMAPVEADAAG